MTDLDAQRVMQAFGDNNKVGRLLNDNDNLFREMNIDDKVMYKGNNQVMEQDVFDAEYPNARPMLVGDLRNQTVGPGVMTDRDAQRVMQAFGGSNNAMPVGQGAMSNQEQDMFMQATPSSPMQPLVDLGFGEEVNIILNNPSESEISMQAQQRIINELGTGMDIDGFLMEVIKVAPDEPELDAGADGIMGLMQ
jgi:hypothetical protein